MERRLALLCRQTETAVALKGERTALCEARKHTGWYLKGLRGAAAFRAEAGKISTLSDLYALCERVADANQSTETEE